MNTTIRNLDERAFRTLKARAALEGMTIGDAVSEAIRTWVANRDAAKRTGSLRDLEPRSWGPGTEHSSEEIDRIVYRSDD